MKDYSIQELAEFINTINHADADAEIEIKQCAGGGAVGVLVGDNGFTIKITPVAHTIAKHNTDAFKPNDSDGEV